MRVIKIVLLFWTDEMCGNFSKPLLKMIRDHLAFKIALRKPPSSLSVVVFARLCANVRLKFVLTDFISKPDVI